LAGGDDKTLAAAHSQLIDAALKIPLEALNNPDRAQDLLDSMTACSASLIIVFRLSTGREDFR